MLLPQDSTPSVMLIVIMAYTEALRALWFVVRGEASFRWLCKSTILRKVSFNGVGLHSTRRLARAELTILLQRMVRDEAWQSDFVIARRMAPYAALVQRLTTIATPALVTAGTRVAAQPSHERNETNNESPPF